VADGLTPEQHRAADLLGRNWSVKDVATEVDASERTVSRWKNEDDDFKAAMKASRDQLLSTVPNAKATLEAALSATTAKGEPDWAIRVKAAQLLMTTADPSQADPGDERPQTFIYIAPDELAS
jgi:Helix-turn-helix of insertion element transposase